MKNRSAFLIVSILFAPLCQATTKYSIQCSACKVEQMLADGPNKWEASHNAPYVAGFYCEKTKKFVELKTKPGIKKPSKIYAAPTKLKNSKGLPLWDHASCRKGLISIQEFADKVTKPCPVCDEGELKVDAVSFID